MLRDRKPAVEKLSAHFALSGGGGPLLVGQADPKADIPISRCQGLLLDVPHRRARCRPEPGKHKCHKALTNKGDGPMRTLALAGFAAIHGNREEGALDRANCERISHRFSSSANVSCKASITGPRIIIS